MMKKILSILLVVAFVCVAVPAFAQMNRFNEDQKILIVTNTNATLNATSTDVTTASVLVAGSHRILGYTVNAITAGTLSEINVGLYDSGATTDNLTDAKLIGEAESRQSAVISLAISAAALGSPRLAAA
jgi:hypothetical protein